MADGQDVNGAALSEADDTGPLPGSSNHAIVDECRLPVRLRLTPVQASDKAVAAMPEGLPMARFCDYALLARDVLVKFRAITPIS